MSEPFFRSRWVEAPAGVEQLDPAAPAPGFRAGAAHCGLKNGGKTDVADEQADVGLAAALEAAVCGAGTEAGRQPRRVELLDPGGRLHPARPEESARPPALLRVRGWRAAHNRPSVSSRPSIRLRHCTAWPDAPFQRLSIAEKASTRPRSVTVTYT